MPSFFKVMVGDFHEQLQIPTAFLKHFDGVLPQKFSLWAPTRRLWDVDVIKIDDNLFFEKGWREFVQDHCLELGDFLVFHYDRKSKFYVNIYGRKTCQKDISKVARNGNGANGEFQLKEEHEDIVSTEVGNLTKLQPLVPPIDIEASAMEHRKSKRVADSYCFVQESREIRNEIKPTTKTCRQLEGVSTLKVGDKAKAKARQIAKDFKSENPFFVVTMQPSYVIGRALTIPTSFSSKYFAGADKNVILRASNGKSWSMKGRFRTYGSETSSSQLYCGWSAFRQANRLKVGDVCLFELVNVTEMCLEVVIFSSE